MTAARRWAAVLAGVPGSAAVAVLVGMLWLTRRSLEMVDESYLLRFVDDPQATRAAGDVYLFGFVLHPVWEWVGEDVALYRATGMLTLAAAGAWLCLEGVGLLRDQGVQVPRGRVVVSCLVSAASTALVFSFNVMVPAYRSVALLGIIVACAGAAKAVRRQPLPAGALIGAGGWTCFVGKPTSAAVLAVTVVVFLVAARLLSWRLIGGAVLGLAVAAGATLVVAEMTPAEAATYLHSGARQLQVLGDHPSLRVLLGVTDPNLQALLVFAPVLLLPVLLATVLRAGRPAPQRLVIDALGIAGLVAAGVASAWVGRSLMGPFHTGWQVFSVGWLVPLAAVAVALRRQRRSGSPPATGLRGWVVLLLVVPYAGAVGSNLPFGAVVPMMAVPWVVALAVLLLARTDNPAWIPSFTVAMSAVVVVVAVLSWVVHSNSPAGGDLARNLEWAPVRGGQLQLSPMDADAARDLARVAEREGITSSTPVVDLTGAGAGYAFLTGGRPLGRAHLYAYLPHSVEAARYGIGRESCSTRAAAWLLVHEGGTAPLSPAMFVDGVGPDDYDVKLRFAATRDEQLLHFELVKPRPSVAAKLGC